MKFFNPVILKDRRINEWLTLVEKEMRVSLARLLAMSVQEAAEFRMSNIDQKRYLEWVDKYQAQLVVLAAQIIWSESMDKALLDTEQGKGKAPDGTTPVQQVMQVVEATLNVLADSVLHEQPPVRRRKLEHLVSVLYSNVHTFVVCLCISFHQGNLPCTIDSYSPRTI